MFAYSKTNSITGITITELLEFDSSQLEKSKMIFEELKENKIICKGNFEDIEWSLTNQIETTNLRFEFDEILYNKEFKKRNMYKFQDFVNSIKCFVLLNIEYLNLKTLQKHLRYIKEYSHLTNFFNENYSKRGLDIFEKLLNGTLPFIRTYLEYVNFEGVEYYLSAIEDLIEYAASLRITDSSKDNRRTLADFQSILMFNEIIENFWKSINSDSSLNEKELYFPLYLWWKISNIIPLRVIEFCVTPYNCIEETDNGQFFITLRRSKIKGKHSNKQIHHNIEKDYKIYKYAISKEIVDLINEYKEITQKNRVKSDLLISYSSYSIRTYGYHENSDIDTSKKRYHRTFSRDSLTRLLQKFFVEIIQNNLNYNILPHSEFLNQRIVGVENGNDTVILEFKPLEDNQISIFRPGDIRHYAMINLVLNDVNPVLVRDLVGHEDINTSFHYFGNTSELVKCMVYSKYKEIRKKEYDKIGKNKDVITNDKIFNRLESNESIEVDNGRCISKSFINGKLDSCILVDADCEKCDFFIRKNAPDKETQRAKLKMLEDKIERQAELIANILNSYKNTPKNNKDLTQNTLKLENSIRLYFDESLKNGGIAWE